jgi:DNA-binding XRE family transcriptional regulator
MTKQELERAIKQAAIEGATIALEAAGVVRNQADAANIVGVTRRTIGNWKRGGAVSAQGTKVKIADVIRKAVKA